MKNIVFDWSGVIENSLDRHLWVVNTMFKKFGTSTISLQELKENWMQPHMLFYQKYLPSLSQADQDIAYQETIRSLECPAAKPFPLMLGLIKELKARKYYLAVISGDLKETLMKEMQQNGLVGMFDDVIVNEYDKTKALAEIVNKRKLDRQTTFFVGDSNQEIVAAKEVGVKSIAVTWGYTHEKVLQSKSPDFLVRSIEELKNILNS